MLVVMAFTTIRVGAQVLPSDFVITINTENPGITGPLNFSMSGNGNTSAYYESIPAGISGNVAVSIGGTHIAFPAAGVYRVAIRPIDVGIGQPLSHIVFSGSDSQKLLTIEQWGTIAWSSMNSSFSGCSNLTAITATDAPVLSNVTDMAEVFLGCSSLASAPNLNNWDVSHATTISGMFYNASSFDVPVGNWNVGNVTNMTSVFVGTKFNQPLDNWNVSNVTNMAYMFYADSAFNQPLNNWNVGNVTAMNNMFEDATAFNQSLGSWTLNASVNTAGMLNATGMNCGSYGNTLIGWAANGATPSGRSLGATGRTYGAGASAARDALINTKGWTITGDALDTACSISATDFVTTWKTDVPASGTPNQIWIPASGNYTIYYESIPAGISGTLPATGTFTDAQFITFQVPGTYRVAIKPVGPVPFHRIAFNLSGYQLKLLTIEQWGTTAWSSMANAFQGSENLITLSGTDTPVLSNLTSLNRAFANCSSLTGSSNMNTWDVGHVTDMTSMFSGAAAFNQPIGNWDVSNVTSMGSMFMGAASFNQPLDNWDVSNVTNMGNMFSVASAFNRPLDNWDVGNVTTMNSMFSVATAFNQPLNSWDVSKVTSMTSMFRQTSAFNQPLNNWNVSNVLAMNFMFDAATAFNQPLGDWTLNAANFMGNMLNNNGMDCNNYSSTLIGWAHNAATPTGRSLGATAKTFGDGASSSRDYLLNTKSWTITGDSFDALCIVLPVTLVSFDAVKQESSSLLTWATTEETNSDRFEIQRSMDTQHWDLIGVVVSGGESTTLKKYHFNDENPHNGINYYRLKMVDRAADRRKEAFAYSRIRSLEFGGAASPGVYPNPASNNLMINKFPDVKKVVVYNTAGTTMLEAGNVSEQGVDISRLLPGLYHVSITLNDGTSEVGKVIISR